MLIIEGRCLSFAPDLVFFIRDHPREAKWISREELTFLETTLRKEREELEPPAKVSVWTPVEPTRDLCHDRALFFAQLRGVRVHDLFARRIEGSRFQPFPIRHSFRDPYAVTAVIMIINSMHRIRPGNGGHVCAVNFLSGVSLV